MGTAKATTSLSSLLQLAAGKSLNAVARWLFDDAHKRKFGLVVFWALDRFTREGMAVSRPIGPTTLEETGIMYALKLAFVTLLVDDGDALGIRKEDATTDESFSTCGPR